MNQDDCVGVRCLNGGTCRDGVRDYKCQCPPGYSGKLCQDRVDLCRGFPCANGGTCADADGLDFKCTCAPGFTGKHCHINVNECESSPCLNGGLCHDRVNEFNCICPPEFSGTVCQFRVSGDGGNDSSSAQPVEGLLLQSGVVGGSSGFGSDASPSREINLIYLISGVVILLLLAVAVSLIVMLVLRRKKQADKERRKDEELARSQNEFNSRSQKNKCLTNDEDEREFRGNRIVNNLNDSSSVKQKELVFNNKLDSYGSSHHLNRSLTLPRFNNIDQQQLHKHHQQQQQQHVTQLPHASIHHHPVHHLHPMKHPVCHHQSTQKLGPPPMTTTMVNLPHKGPQHHTSQHNLSTFKSVGNGLYV